ncbi:MAG: hypothetical protein HYV33_02485 [Candidatus Kerfeldbacteria bacterium]|nr:hypothetical protein [Candidatus Kerfeldbacteria bacterium]
MQTPLYQEYRCPNDNKLLFRGLLIDSEIEIKCRNCKQLVVLNGTPSNAWLCLKKDCPHREID